MRDCDAARVLIGVETYNAMLLDRGANDAARILAERSDVAQTGSSDAHVVDAVGLGTTFFPGHTPEDLIAALWTGTTQVRVGERWGAAHVVASWTAHYLMSKMRLPVRIPVVAAKSIPA